MRMRRIGHKGADLIVPGNTPASFDAALAHGVDMIEFDVLPEFQHEPAKGRLLLATTTSTSRTRPRSKRA
jgi:glycerophosphoryl diester phosphodiesterase